MVNRQVIYRSLAVSSAVLIAFIGLCHEFVGAVLFPWGPAAFGGTVGWHAVGLAGIVAGLVLVASTLHVFELPVLALSLFVATVGIIITAYTAMMHQQFHFFAVTLALAAVLMAVCHRRAEADVNA